MRSTPPPPCPVSHFEVIRRPFHVDAPGRRGFRDPQVNEFVNTWSIEGFREEGVAPAEMGWGTHERRLPAGAHAHAHSPCNQICLARMGIKT